MKVSVIEINDIKNAARWIAKTGAEPYSVALMSKKAFTQVLFVEGLDNRAANFVKQDMLSIGGEAAVNRDIGAFKKGISNILIMGTQRQIELLLEKIKAQPFGLSNLSLDIKEALSNYCNTNLKVKCGRFTIDLSNMPVVMGIINITPDSFYDGARYMDPEKALDRAFDMVRDGAGIIDIGGESSRPGSKPVLAKEELLRILPVIKTLCKSLKIPVSVDTYKPEVAKAVLDAGAAIINDITGLAFGKNKMTGLISKYKAGVVVMHMKGTPRTMQVNPAYADVVLEVKDYFADKVLFARQSGIPFENIILDPGIGFGKKLEHNLEILNRLKEFTSLGLPILVGASRKSFISKVSGNDPVAGRLSGSIASSIAAVENGANFLRVHDVKETVDALKVYKAIKGNN